MHTLLFLVLAACSGSSSTEAPEPETRVSRPVPPTVDRTRATIGVEALKARIDAGETVRIVDVRMESELAGGVIPGAVAMPLGEYTPTAPPVSTTPKDEPIYFVAGDIPDKDARAQRAAEITAAAGFTAVEVAGGIAAWQAAGYPLEQLLPEERPK